MGWGAKDPGEQGLCKIPVDCKTRGPTIRTAKFGSRGVGQSLTGVSWSVEGKGNMKELSPWLKHAGQM